MEDTTNKTETMDGGKTETMGEGKTEIIDETISLGNQDRGRGVTHWSYSGSTMGAYHNRDPDWGAIRREAEAAAAKKVFERLCNEPGVARVEMGEDNLRKLFKDHGTFYEYNGGATYTETDHHEHADHNALGKRTHWQGWMSYKYNFPIIASTI